MRPANNERSSIRTTLLAILVAAIGCGPPASQPAAAEPPAAENREYWDAIFFEESKVGYAHTLYDTVTENGRRLRRITASSILSIRRFGQVTRQQLLYRSFETPGGEVVRFDSSMSSGEGATASVTLEAKGEVRGEEIDLQLSTLGKTQRASLPWNRSWGGYFAMEQSLERQPLQPGEKRTLRSLTPGFNQTADVEFVAGQFESTATLDGPRELLRIETKILLGENVLEQIVWTDRGGQIMKTLMPALKQVTYRTSKVQALVNDTGSFDLGRQSVVPVDREIDQPHQTRRIRYRARLTSGDVRKAFASSATQRVKIIDDRTAEITVRSLRPTDDRGADFPSDLFPTPEDLSPNSLIQCDDEQVVQLAREGMPGKRDPWEIAVALEQRVRQFVRNKNFSQALSSAAEVVRTREGDCTEHAVLLAALCRAREIPARVVIGMIYHRPSSGFAYHMWTEVWIQDRWLPLDATLGLGGIGAGHLAVSHSNLKGIDPLTQFLPVLQLIGNVKLEVMDIE